MQGSAERRWRPTGLARPAEPSPARRESPSPQQRCFACVRHRHRHSEAHHVEAAPEQPAAKVPVNSAAAATVAQPIELKDRQRSPRRAASVAISTAAPRHQYVTPVVEETLHQNHKLRSSAAQRKEALAKSHSEALQAQAGRDDVLRARAELQQAQADYEAVTARNASLASDLHKLNAAHDAIVVDLRDIHDEARFVDEYIKAAELELAARQSEIQSLVGKQRGEGSPHSAQTGTSSLNALRSSFEALESELATINSAKIPSATEALLAARARNSALRDEIAQMQEEVASNHDLQVSLGQSVRAQLAEIAELRAQCSAAADVDFQAFLREASGLAAAAAASGGGGTPAAVGGGAAMTTPPPAASSATRRAQLFVHGANGTPSTINNPSTLF